MTLTVFPFQKKKANIHVHLKNGPIIRQLHQSRSLLLKILLDRTLTGSIVSKCINDTSIEKGTGRVLLCDFPTGQAAFSPS